MATTDKNTITLYAEDDSLLEKIQKDLTRIYTKDAIVLLLKPIYMILDGCTRLVKCAGVAPKADAQMEDFMKRRYACAKDTCAHLLALALCDLRNVELLLEHCQVPHALEIMRIALMRYVVTQDDLAEALPSLNLSPSCSIDVDGFTGGKTCGIPFIEMVEHAHYQYRMNGKQRMYCFQITIRQPFRQILRTMLMGDLLPKPMAELPEDKALHVFSEGYEMEANFPMLLMAERAGKLSAADRGLSAAHMKYALSNVPLTDFHPSFTGPDHKGLRTRLGLSHLLSERQVKSFCSDEYPELLKRLPEYFKRYNPPTLLTFRHVKGFTMRYANDSYSDNLCQWLMDYLQDMYGGGQEGWLSLSGLLEELACSDLSESVLGFVYRMSYSSFWYGSSTSLYNKFSNEEISDGFGELTCPYIRALLLSMAAVGMFDAALREPSDNNLSPYDALEYVRITPLGRYALGYADTYNPSAGKSFGCFEADSEHLIVRLIGEKNPYTAVVAEMAQPIGQGRYAFTPQSMMRGISSRAALLERIKLFRTYVAENPPAIWERFFHQLTLRCTALVTDSLVGYTMYHVSPAQIELLALLAPGTEIGSLCLHVEGHRLLVSSEHHARFLRLLREKGYVV